MERIEEEIFQKIMSFNVDDPYAVAINILESARRIGRVREKVNKFLTTGPRKRFELSFSLSDSIDKYSRTLFSFDISGETPPNIMKIDIKGIFQIRLPTREGFVKEVFSEYYVKKMMPRARSVAKQRATQLENEILNVVDYTVEA